jgi:hypothetical protein
MIKSDKPLSVGRGRLAVAIRDATFTSVGSSNLTNSNTSGAADGETTAVSEFLTVQSLTNFAAMSGAITVGWKALQVLDQSVFKSNVTPFVLACLWLLVSLVSSAASEPSARKVGFLVPALFLGFLNTLVLFAAAVGVNSV